MELGRLLLVVWVAQVPTEAREDKREVCSGRYPDPEEEQVPNLTGVWEALGREAGGGVTTDGPGEQ